MTPATPSDVTRPHGEPSEGEPADGEPSDVVVVGDGPAGLAAATALGASGLAVTLLAVARDGPWPNTFGVWDDELDGLDLPRDAVLAHRWPQVVVAFDGGHRTLPRAYGLLDNAGLEAVLRRRAADRGVITVPGRAVDVTHDPAGSTVTTADGRRWRARVVVDASGHRPALAVRADARAAAHQTAYGVVGRFRAPPVPPGAMVLMDYRADHLDPAADRADPTFLYGMDLGDGRFFVEETCLARRPGLPLDELERRLSARLAATGSEAVEVHHVERVAFPMGGPLPPRDQRVVAFGGAAGMVHPATGYQVGTALRRAPRLAAALAAAIGDAAADGAAVSAAGWGAVWPRDLVRQRDLHLFGLETLLGLDGPRLRAFFSAFFALPEDRWRGYLSGAGSAHELATSMLMLFGRADPALRRALAGAALGRAARHLVRALR